MRLKIATQDKKQRVHRQAGASQMDRQPKGICTDPTEEITIRIPCALAERIAAYASDNQSTPSSVIIEALDFFLRQGSK
jgi:hypothetical protein